MLKINLSNFFIALVLLTNPTKALAFEEKDVRATIIKLGGVDKFLRLLVDSQSKNLPQQLDSETKLISIFATDSTLHLTHQLINTKSKSELDKKFVDGFIKFQTSKVCTSPVGKIALTEFNAKYRYQYLGNSGESLIVFDVIKKNCMDLK
jgi:hypothetical protein